MSKDYSGTRALDRVSFELEPGQVVGVLGANGAGKTTLLRCLATVSAPDRGEIYADEEPLRRANLDQRRRLAFVPDVPLVFWNLSFIQHLGMMVRVHDADSRVDPRRVIELLREFDLTTLAARPLQTLSRGQAYKAVLTALIAVDPEVWLLDEPFASGMDPHGLDTLKQEARKAAQRRRTILYTTQILEVAERFSDRVCVLHRGELRAFDTVEQLKSAAGGEGSPLESLFRQLRAEHP